MEKEEKFYVVTVDFDKVICIVSSKNIAENLKDALSDEYPDRTISMSIPDVLLSNSEEPIIYPVSINISMYEGESLDDVGEMGVDFEEITLTPVVIYNK